MKLQIVFKLSFFSAIHKNNSKGFRFAGAHVIEFCSLKSPRPSIKSALHPSATDANCGVAGSTMHVLCDIVSIHDIGAEVCRDEPEGDQIIVFVLPECRRRAP